MTTLASSPTRGRFPAGRRPPRSGGTPIPRRWRSPRTAGGGGRRRTGRGAPGWVLPARTPPRWPTAAGDRAPRDGDCRLGLFPEAGDAAVEALHGRVVDRVVPGLLAT